MLACPPGRPALRPPKTAPGKVLQKALASRSDPGLKYGTGHLVRSGVQLEVNKTRNGKGPRRSTVHRPVAFGAAIDASVRGPKAPIYCFVKY
jgi:hypothetical protein